MAQTDGIPARFKQALQRAEEERDASHLAKLFDPDAHLTNLGGDHSDDANEFWNLYLQQFHEIRSEFTGEIVTDGQAALEWRSHGRTADGRPVEYRGVSLLDFDGDAITGFRTYYDSAAFVRTA